MYEHPFTIAKALLKKNTFRKTPENLKYVLMKKTIMVILGIILFSGILTIILLGSLIVLTYATFLLSLALIAGILIRGFNKIKKFIEKYFLKIS